MLKKHSWGHFLQTFFSVRRRYFNNEYTAKRFHQNIFTRLNVIQTLNFAKIVSISIISKMEDFDEKCMRETMFRWCKLFKFCLMLKTSESPCISNVTKKETN